MNTPLHQNGTVPQPKHNGQVWQLLSRSRLPLARLPILPLEPLTPKSFPLWKRMLDLVGSVAGLLLIAPLMLLIALAVKLTSPGPIFYSQVRIGYRGKPFRMYKFRSMAANSNDALHVTYLKEFMNGTAEKNADGAFKLKDDPRITPVGNFIRKWSLDELPQLFNVLQGDMSLVGPRPDPWYAGAEYAPWHHLRTRMTKPGLTGLWQVEGRCLVSFAEMVRMDIRYGQSLSFIRDLILISRTFKAVIKQSGAY
jgi:lipopolysaccharide/colanic/teichoic acid biosynthesis glycosyltransferase